jgi:acyl-CoA synthetase (NDP forming)
MSAGATAEHYRTALELVLADPGVDSVIVIFIPPLVTGADEVAAAIVAGAGAAGAKPVLSCFLSARGVPEALRNADRCIPSYVFPEPAALALARATEYGAWRRRPAGTIRPIDGLRVDEAPGIVEAAGSGWLEPEAATALLDAYGITVDPGTPADSGIDAFLAVTTDPIFGPLVALGLGGVFAELLGEVAFRITPVTDRDAREMIRSLRTFPLLEGWRGGPAGDIDALEATIMRVSAMVDDIPELAEMELSPLRVLRPGKGVVVLEARVRVSAPAGSNSQAEAADWR